MRIHYFQHVTFEGLGYIADWAKAKGHTVTVTKWYEAPIPPALEDLDMLIVMGGPMGVYEEDLHPWLSTEKEFIRRAIAAGKPVLGICLGSQLIAAALGARVYPNKQKEIGWFPVQFHDGIAPSPTTVFHWHGDTFDLPENAIHLAETSACKNQAYRIGDRVVGLQFHFEITPEALEGMITHCGHELVPDTYVQTAAEIRGNAHYAQNTNVLISQLLNGLEKLA
ncbi:type 1 glutamine amidotransferase [Chitinophaga niabensis]|uniref:GMP synthase-Glutamine amidotransferase n=1 Tax=Chitinophaga niabensis TaxID=536979 RepID=A0A1N6KEA8_9BACT|nr:gamma-glutamyl-gamma-aminobutyrate hydrolase family protein [Chitinophaga niabensis]SIO54888.1 GMP synthase-Glutamine amidotransferase [Chitinophaga niabensis]